MFSRGSGNHAHGTRFEVINEVTFRRRMLLYKMFRRLGALLVRGKSYLVMVGWPFYFQAGI